VPRTNGDPLVATIDRVLAGLRWSGVLVLTLVLIYTRDQIDRGRVALACLAASLAVTVWRQLHPTMSPRLARIRLGVEVLVAGALLAADGWVYDSQKTFLMPALGAVWPLAAVIAVGTTYGPRRGALIGGVIAASRLLGALAPDVVEGPFDVMTFDELYGNDTARLIPMTSLLALYVLAGAGAGQLTTLIRRTATSITDLETRREVARTLHDSVLQTLAVIERRSTDRDIARLARDADRNLRRYLTTITSSPTLADALTNVAQETEALFDRRVTLAVASDLTTTNEQATDAAVGAAREALANAAKHTHDARITLYAGEADGGGVEITVVDDGPGFDPIRVALRGAQSSIIDRLTAAGGTAAIDSRPGAGTEVRLWIP